MTETPILQPLVTYRVGGEVTEQRFATMLNLRGAVGNPAFVQAVETATGMVLPQKVNAVSASAEQRLFCLGPDEWLYLHKQPSDTEQRISQALQGMHHSVVDVAHGFVHLQIQGVHAGMWLQRGCPLDLHSEVFPTGCAAQSHFAKANVLLYAVQAGEHFEMTVRRSFAQYVRDYLRACQDA